MATDAASTTERDFLLADLGEGLDEATIVTWLVKVGDTVELNQTLCVVETAKAEVEVPSPFAGRVVALGGAEGETLAVGAMLARIAAVDEPAPSREPTLVGYGHDASIDRSRRGAAAPSASAGGTIVRTPPGSASRTRRVGANPRKPITKPPVRLLARRLGVDLDDLVPGSGPGGVVTRSDVEAAAHSADRTRQVDQNVPVTGVRARIAEHLTRSRREIPDATATVVADCNRLLEVRDTLSAHAEQRGVGAAITPFALLCRLVVQALGEVPVLNSSFMAGADDGGGPEIRVHPAVHLGIATSTERGLVVTVVRDAQRRGVLDLAAELVRLSEGARAGSLPPADLTGSTFTISNFGALGLDDGIPIINHPEAAILGVGSIRHRPHVVDGEVVARPTVALTLVFDHRVCDGAEAARFLTGLRDLIETPELALLGR